MQTRLMSLVEAAANVLVGYGVAVSVQIAVFPMFGIVASISDSLAIGAIFTIVSIVRSYVLRRLFERIKGISPWPTAKNRRALFPAPRSPAS